MSDGSDDGGNGDEWSMSLSVDLVHVEVSGPDREGVKDEFRQAVEVAFRRYDKHVADDSDGRHHG